MSGTPRRRGAEQAHEPTGPGTVAGGPGKRAAVPDLADLPYAAALTPHQGRLAAGEVYDTAHFDGAEVEDPDAEGARFLECAFTHVSVRGGRLDRARFSDVWLRDVRLTGVRLADSAWVDATVSQSALAGVAAFGAQLTRVVFSGCKLEAVNFRSARLTEVVFADCVLREADFAGATLARCSFVGSRLAGTDFTQASLQDVDLRGAELGLIVGPDSLRGAVLTTAQVADIAPLLAESMGIAVRDD